MTKTPLYEVPARAWYSNELYQEVATRWKGANGVYLFLFLLVCWIPSFFKQQNQLSTLAQQWVEPLFNQVPPFGISSGKLWVEGEPRRVISDPRSGRPLILIDTTGETRSFDSVESSIMVLVTPDFVAARKSNQGVETHPFAGEPDRSVSRADLDVLKAKATYHAPFFIWYLSPLMLLCSLLFRFFQAVVLAVLGLGICSFRKTHLPFQALIRLSVVALTPAMMVRTVCNVLDLYIPMLSVILVLVTLGYLVFGISVNQLLQRDTPRRARSDW